MINLFQPLPCHTSISWAPQIGRASSFASDMLTTHGTVMGYPYPVQSVGCELNSISHADRGPITLVPVCNSARRYINQALLSYKCLSSHLNFDKITDNKIQMKQSSHRNDAKSPKQKASFFHFYKGSSLPNSSKKENIIRDLARHSQQLISQ